MKEITMREFAILCRDDPALFTQTVAIPKTPTPEKIFDLAARNGYRIAPEQGDGEAVGSAAQEARWKAMHTWMYYVMGFGEEQ